ncbi:MULTISPECIES: TRAP transporter small permease [unclassified Azospirillum]|uniref:TRAP transporter small permease n=1 Tax=unclassified Azospirillum TaxID=2630922 RepID=UPI002857C204|nr:MULTISPECIES: TRAP transporter small permease [unclassified Azospirillum]MDR6771217.1 C4-dicarboxylate transporter DctQ subunit [Azospirillum sp. BE72]HYF85432.1 TRAP transporter small permease [Azospirillum sp.]
MLMKILDRLEETLIASLMAAATLVIFVAVMHRYLSGVAVIQDYVIHWNLAWAQEVCIYMFVWMAKFGAAYGVRTGIHVGVDVVINRLRPDIRGRFVVFGLLAGALFTGVVGALGANFVYHIAETEQVSADMELPMWLVYLAIPLGSFLMCFRFLQVAWTFIRTGELPHHDHAQVDGIDPVEAANEGGPA